MSYKILNGYEIAFLLGLTEDNDKSFVVFEEELRKGTNGYEQTLVVVKHPDGNFYEFVYEYNTEYRITPCLENPKTYSVQAYQVKPVIKTVTTYERIKD